MARNNPATVSIVKSELDPGEGAIATGERIQWGNKLRDVYVLEDDILKHEPILDPTTNQPMYKRGAGGVTLGSYHTRLKFEGKRVREFIVDSLGNGQTYRIYKGFRSDPEEARLREERAQIDRFQKDLADAAVKEGVSVADLVALAKVVKQEAAAKSEPEQKAA